VEWSQSVGEWPSWLVSELVREWLSFSLYELLAEAGDCSGTHRKGKVRRWKPLRSNGREDVAVDISMCVISLSLYCLTALWNLTAFYQFLILQTVSSTPWTEDQPVERPLPTQRTTQTQNKRAQTSIPLVGFEPMIPDIVF
jgi:hypothetical protein